MKTTTQGADSLFPEGKTHTHTHTHVHTHTHTHTNPKYYRFVQRVKWPQVLGVFLVLVLVLFLTEFVVKIFGEIKDTGKVMKHISLS